jgi:hypothetical protein
MEMNGQLSAYHLSHKERVSGMHCKKDWKVPRADLDIIKNFALHVTKYFFSHFLKFVPYRIYKHITKNMTT